MAFPVTSQLKGLNNTTDPVKLGLKWLTRADNVNVMATGGVHRREGHQRVIGAAMTGAFNSADLTRLYVAADDYLCVVAPDLSLVPLCPLTSRTPLQWAQLNDHIYFTNGSDSGVIDVDHTVMPWALSAPATPTLAAGPGSLPPGQYQVRLTHVWPDGREGCASDAAAVFLTQPGGLFVSDIALGPTGSARIYIAPADSTVYQLAAEVASNTYSWDSSPDALGAELTNAFMDAVPFGAEVIAAWRGRVYASLYLPTEDQTAIFFSEPLAAHLFNYAESFISVPGRVLAMAPHDEALVIGTDRKVYAYTPAALKTLADYGVVPGMPWAVDGKRLLIWTLRGLCQFPDFTNLTSERVSVAPGTAAGAAVVEQDGQARFVASLHAGGIAFNPRKEVSP
ncbi:hypothetical protein DBR23_17645 [Acidovorax sp. HMWF018]|uniref:hypothetical protein n=1 Tax=Acidovorax sp. HMWF018 TaxID=2056855 RepID=UPI000D339933|nr:hypothetical protein [Acidovorax sp. HMWF018]PTT37388.1 hypothetical protein DBR23_17645 [Acidovorax sp. HMWF018]